MANPWFRFYAEFLHDPKVRVMSDKDQLRLVLLFCLRCNGNVTLQDKYVTFALRISDEEWQQTKVVFIESGFIDSDNNVLNWDKRQYISDSSAVRVAKHRALHKTVTVTPSNVTVTPSNVTVTPPEQIQNRTDTEQNISNTKVLLVTSDAVDCPHSEIIKLYAELLPELPQPRIWEGQRKNNLIARWKWVLSDLKKHDKPDSREDGIDFFRRMFVYISKSDFLMGRSEKWSAELGWIVKSENFAKIIQGNYENKDNP